MSRIQSSDFPDSISDVVYQSGRFSPVASGKLSSVFLQEGAKVAVTPLRGGAERCHPVGNGRNTSSSAGGRGYSR